MFTIVFELSLVFLLIVVKFLSFCFFFNTDFSLITLLLELIAAESFCNVGVIGTDGELVAGDVCGVTDCLGTGADGGGSKRQNVPE